MRLFGFIFIIAVIFSGCSSKKYFEPEDTLGDYETTVHNFDNKIVDFTNNGATLENNEFISKKGYIKNILPKDYKFLNSNGDTILAADNNKTLLIRTKDKDEYHKFDNNIIHASKNGTLTALGFTNNSVMLYDTVSKAVKYKEYFKHSELNDIKIANGVFLEGVVLLPTLDGKVAIVDSVNFQTIQVINIDPRNEINNIIFLSNENEKLVAATLNKVFVFNNNKTYAEDHNVKFVAVKDNHIYVATLEGEIIKYDMELKEQNKQKFLFAKFHALVASSKIYALEYDDYLIELDTNLENTKVYDFSFDDEEKVISIDNKLYFEESYIELP